VPSFSQHSDSALRSRNPDLVAPGVGIVAPAAAGSTLAGRYPDALLGSGFLRGSGTSQAAAVVSGAAALLWQKWPNLSPTQIRELLVNSAVPLGRLANQAYQGKGELNLVAAAARKPADSPRRAGLLLGLTDRLALGFGTLQGARGSSSVTLNSVPLSGERDIFGRSWNSGLLAILTAGRRAWTLNTGSFNGSVWIGTGFLPDTVTVAGQTWNGRTWAGRTWAGRTWTGQTWTGQTWAGQTWAGRTWAGPIWADYRWQ
jgi:serine protease AprX